MADPLALYAQRILRNRGVEIVLKDRLAAATSEKAILKSGKEILRKDHHLNRAFRAAASGRETRLRERTRQAAGGFRSRSEGLRGTGLGTR
jgi:hypothetical protein